jgi:hypothetical protein
MWRPPAWCPTPVRPGRSAAWTTTAWGLPEASSWPTWSLSPMRMGGRWSGRGPPWLTSGNGGDRRRRRSGRHRSRDGLRRVGHRRGGVATGTRPGEPAGPQDHRDRDHARPAPTDGLFGPARDVDHPPSPVPMPDRSGSRRRSAGLRCAGRLRACQPPRSPGCGRPPPPETTALVAAVAVRSSTHSPKWRPARLIPAHAGR